jgi:hypothetical protein
MQILILICIIQTFRNVLSLIYLDAGYIYIYWHFMTSFHGGFPPLYNWFPTKNMAAGNTKNPWKFWPSQWNFLIYFSISSYPLENSLLIFNLSSGIYFPLLTIPWKFHTFLLSLFIPTLWNFHRFALKIGPYHGNFCIFGSPLFFGGGGLLEILMSSIGGGGELV